MKTLLLVISILIGGWVTLIFVGRERLGIGSGLVQIIAPDVGTVMGVLDGERSEGKGALSLGGHPHLGANVYRTRSRGLLGAGRQSTLQTDRV